MNERLLSIIKNFANKKVLVIGDVMLDRYISGEVSRISPEAPVPVVNIKKEDCVPGGASNLAYNIASLGGKCHLIGLIGNDTAGVVLKGLLEKKGIDVSGLLTHDYPTTQKIRIVSDNKQLLRLDNEEKSKNEREAEAIEYIRRVIEDIEVIAISDYAKGTITENLLKELFRYNRIIVVDPKLNMSFYKGVYLIKPNKSEAEKVTGIEGSSEESINSMGRILLDICKANILISRGNEGMSLFETSGKVTHISSQAKEVYDVTGAGDTTIATLSLALASGADIKEATILSNYAAGIKVGKAGTAVVSAKELAEFLEKKRNKVTTREEIIQIAQELKNKGRRIVFTNGCFDILHVGHTRLLQKARDFGDIFIVGLDTDDSIRKLKGPSRPIISHYERAEILSALECIDYIVFFEEGDPLDLIKAVRPDVLVKGDDYREKIVVGREFVESYGGKVELIPLVEGVSTTGIMERIKNTDANKT